MRYRVWPWVLTPNITRPLRRGITPGSPACSSNCSHPAVPLDLSATCRGTCCTGNSISSIYHCPSLHPIISSLAYTPTPTAWRGHSSFASGVVTARGATVTDYKSSLDWHSSLPTVGGILEFLWTATAHLKLGSHQPVRFCPARFCHSHLVHGD